MNRKLAFLFSAAAIILFSIGAVAVCGSDEPEELCFPAGVITLDPPEWVEQKRASVEFPHSLHFNYSCKTCHHMWEGEDDIVTCTGCHDLEEYPQADDEKILYYKTAYHQLCIDCHKALKVKNQQMAQKTFATASQSVATGPTSCGGCHPKD